MAEADIQAIVAGVVDGSGSIGSLLLALEDLEFELGSDHKAAVLYSTQLMAYYTVNDVDSARFLWKRIASPCKQDAELEKVWRIGQLLWAREYEQMFALLSTERGTFSSGVAGLLGPFARAHQARMLALLSKAYTLITPAVAAGCMGISPSEIVQYLTSLGWIESEGLMIPSTTSAGVNEATRNRAEGMKQLQHLTEYVVHLDA